MVSATFVAALGGMSRLTDALEELTNDCIQRHKEAIHDRNQGRARVIVKEALGYIQLPRKWPLRVRALIISQVSVACRSFTYGGYDDSGQYESVRKRMVAQQIKFPSMLLYQKRMPVGVIS